MIMTMLVVTLFRREGLAHTSRDLAATHRPGPDPADGWRDGSGAANPNPAGSPAVLNHHTPDNRDAAVGSVSLLT